MVDQQLLELTVDMVSLHTQIMEPGFIEGENISRKVMTGPYLYQASPYAIIARISGTESLGWVLQEQYAFRGENEEEFILADRTVGIYEFSSLTQEDMSAGELFAQMKKVLVPKTAGAGFYLVLREI